MHGWRGMLAGRIPAPMLRAGADQWLTLAGPRIRTSTASARQIRASNYERVHTILSRFGSVEGAFNSLSGPVCNLEVLDVDDYQSIRFAFAEVGLTASQLSADDDEPREFRVGALATGRSEIDNALATAVFLYPPGRDRPAMPDALDVTFGVDAVYTWVDGDDLRWQGARKEARTRVASQVLPTADDRGRFTSHDELRYSLRSLEYFAPWIRRVHLVTAGQTPKWLNASDERLNVVDHRDLFANPTDLPTFNSHAIEAQLHNIRGLTEHFIYMNDDVFLGRPLSPSKFFTPSGQPKFFPSENVIRASAEEELPVDVAARNNRAIIEGQFGKTISRKFKHAPHAQRRSTLESIGREHAEAVARTTSAKFRSETDLSIPSSLAHYYGLCVGKAVPGTIEYGYVDIGASEAQVQLLRILNGRRPETFCINEVKSRPHKQDQVSKMIYHFLERAFPLASNFELPESRPSMAQTTL